MGPMKQAIAREEKQRARRMKQPRSANASMPRVIMNFISYRNGWRYRS
jgi:hypothetical protein